MPSSWTRSGNYRYRYPLQVTVILDLIEDLFFIILFIMKTSYVYIMSNYTREVFYVGSCDNLEIRVSQHKNGEGGYFTALYKCYYLVYFEVLYDIEVAIKKEKQLKHWNRDWKIELIKKDNPDMKDLSEGWYEQV